MHLGDPNYKTVVPMPDGSMQELTVTDKYGLPCDPATYAKPSCSACYGKGIRSITNLTTVQNGVRHTRPGPNLLRCGCVDRTYEKIERILLTTYPDLKVK